MSRFDKLTDHECGCFDFAQQPTLGNREDDRCLSGVEGSGVEMTNEEFNYV